MRLMSDGVQKSSGEKLQRALGALTGNRFKGFLTGLGVTMIIQSSGATTAMVVSFVNAGLLTLKQSVGVIFGANIGTTITAWIVSIFGFNFKISAFAIPVFGVGFFLTLRKNQQSKNIGEAVMGFGALFLGLAWLSDVFSFDPSELGFLASIQNLGVLSVIISFFVGFVITALMHSSSAFSAIVITMAHNGIVTWPVAAAMTLGSEVGSTIDAVLASLGTNADARRAALVHVFFNLVGTTLALICFRPFLALIEYISGDANLAIRISILHTVFKTINSCIFMPFISQLVKITYIFIKDDKNVDDSVYHLEFSENLIGKDNPPAHIIRLEKEVSDMSGIAFEMFTIIENGFNNRNTEFIEKDFVRLEKKENYCDQMNEAILRYVVNMESLSLTEVQRNELSKLTQISDELEAMTDECATMGFLIKRSIEKNMKFETEDINLLFPYLLMAKDFVQFIKDNVNKKITIPQFKYATELEAKIDQQKNYLKKTARKHIEGGADVKSGLMYIDFVRHIEKLGDHAYAVAELLT
ncbi:MAG: Na/Pi cotransporter family protein [Treponema sp.]|nr:Na/Pi cotransporter family protein [Treponema sp.]